MAPRPGARGAPGPHGPTLLAIRRARRRSAADVAAAAGMSAGYLSKVERGLHSAASEFVDRLAVALDVPVEVLTGQVPPLRALRRIAGVHLDDLAFAVGTTPGRLERLERGTERPGPEELELLARRLGVPVEALGAGAAAVAS